MFKGKVNIGVGLLALIIILDQFLYIPSVISGFGIGLSLVLIIYFLFKGRKH